MSGNTSSRTLKFNLFFKIKAKKWKYLLPVNKSKTWNWFRPKWAVLTQAFDPRSYAIDPRSYAFDPRSYAFDPRSYAFDQRSYAFCKTCTHVFYK